jgi:hypothetical protein
MLLLRATRQSERSVGTQAGMAPDRLGTTAMVVGSAVLLKPMIRDAVRPGVARTKVDGVGCARQASHGGETIDGPPDFSSVPSSVGLRMAPPPPRAAPNVAGVPVDAWLASNLHEELAGLASFNGHAPLSLP